MPKIVVEIEWDTPDEPSWLNADNVALALHAYCPNTKFQVRQSNGLSASEALYGFVCWLTTRSKCTVMSSADDFAPNLIDRFCKANRFAEPKQGWVGNLIYPAAD